MEKLRNKRLLVALLVLLTLGWPPLAAAAVALPSKTLAMPYEGQTAEINVSLNKSKVLDFPSPVKILSVGNPEIADIVVVGSRQIYVLGKAMGNTNVVLWDRNRKVQGSLNIQVTPDLQALKASLHEMLPTERIEVRTANGRIILAGEITSAARMDAALRVANSFVPEGAPPILNMMQVGGAQQVMLDVKVAEVSRSLVKRLDAQFNVFNVASSSLRLGAVKGGATFPDAVFESADGLGGRVPALPGGGTPVGPVIDEFAPVTPTIEDAGIFASYMGGDYLLNLVLDAANQQGVAKILAEPNLTTLTGEPAQFLAGGEVPIPVPQGDDQVTIEYKDFGVGLEFLPVVLDSGVINLSVDVAVSDLSNNNSIVVAVGDASSQFYVPSLVKRSASSTVELASGQTIAIAGMLSENLRESVTKFPGLGEIPILGALFRSQEFIKDQTELVIFVTPRLAQPVLPEQVRLPTGSFVAPTDVEFYLMGKMQGRTPESPVAPLATDPLLNRREGGTEGQFGHDL